MALVRAGEIELAAADAAQYGATMAHYRRCQVSYRRALAVLAEARGEPGEAQAHLRAAVSLAEAIGLPGELWQLYRLLGHTQPAEATQQWLAGRIDDAR